MIQKESGGNLAEVLDKTSHVIRERFRLKREDADAHGAGTPDGMDSHACCRWCWRFALYIVNPDMMSILWTARHRHQAACGRGSGMIVVGRLDHSQDRQHGSLERDVWDIAILAFCVVFLLIASGGLLLFYREAMLQRISEVINPQPKPKIPAGHHSADGLFDRRRGGALRERAAEEPGGSLRCSSSA